MFRFSIGDTAYYILGGIIRSGVVSRRTYDDNNGRVTISYYVVNPNNSAQVEIVEEHDMLSEYNAAKEVLVAQENTRHEERIKEIEAL
jgi:hypothetical protein